MQARVNKKQERLELLERHTERLERRIGRLNASYHRWLLQQFVVFVGGIILSASLISLFAPLGLLSVLALIGLFLYGWRTIRILRKRIGIYTGLLRVKQTHIARMKLDWENIPPVEDEREKDHPFENDLQISGPSSLYRLINSCQSDQGRARLHQWLLNRVPERTTIRARQAIVRELVPLIRFRDMLQVHSRRVILDINKQSDGETLLLWLNVPQATEVPLFILVISGLLSVLLGSLFVLYMYGYMPLVYVLGTFALSLLWSLLTTRYRSRLFADSSLMVEIFKQLHTAFAFLESYPYGKNDKLKQVAEPFWNTHPRPSKLLKRLKKIAQGAQVTQNQVVRQGMPTLLPEMGQALPFLFNAIIPWDLFLVYLLARCKDQVRENLPRWLDIWYEVEALCSLATFAYLNPDFVMPQIADSEGQQAAFCATQLGHPLIADEERIVNDVAIERVGDLMLITGSNMAGKSTFLRTLGINLCLAYAGTSVCAASLQTGLYELHCCISVSDSLVDGYSYFYAEVRRLKFILDRLREHTPEPVFVLIDEIFKGTNNRERSIGSHAYIYALTEEVGIGAISTHDLELVTLADELPQIKNFHFREEVIDGEMVFDYKFYPGPCPTTNALKIMQKEGLPITWRKPVS